MPITIRHGAGDISGMVGLAALAGAMGARAPEAPGIVQIPSAAGGFGGGGGGGGIRGGMGGMSRDKVAQLDADRNVKIKEIDAQADRDKQAADDAMKRLAVQAGLQSELQEQEYDREVKMLQEKAKADAQQMKYKFSIQQKQEIAKYNNAEASVRKSVQEGSFSSEEGETALKKIAQMRAGLKPGAYAKDENEPPPPREQIWVDPETGAVMAPARSASVLVQPDKRPEYLQQKAERDRQAKLQDSRITLLTKLSSVVLSDEAKDLATGKETKKDRLLTQQEIDKRMNMVFGPSQQQEQPQEPIGPTGPESDWWDALESQGVSVSEERRGMPLEQGSALSLYDAYIQKFGSFENVPDELKPAFAEIIKTVRKHRGQR